MNENNKDVLEIAARFVDLVSRRGRWNLTEAQGVPSVEELQVLFDTISAAGFESKGVAPGKLRGNYREQDGNSTGETYPINGFSPFKVVDQNGVNNIFATGWLDCAFRLVLGKIAERGKLIEAIAVEIERSIPLAPIRLTSNGDLLCESSQRPSEFGLEYFVNHRQDDHELSYCVGVHKYCDSWMDRKRTSDTHDVIVCRGCFLRVSFPKEVKTYGDLRQVLKF